MNETINVLVFGRSGEVMPIAAIHGQEVPASALLDNRGGIWGAHDHHWQQAH